MNRRNIIIIALVVVAILLGVGAYFYFSKKPSTPSTGGAPSFPTESGGIPSSFGGENGSGETTEGGSGTSFGPGAGGTLPRLYELHKAPVAGVGIFETGKSPLLYVSARYLERGLGNIFETPLASLTETRVSNETHQGIAEALWGNGGQSVVIRYLDNQIDNLIKTHVLNLSIGTSFTGMSTTTASTQTMFLKTEEVFLPDAIPFLSVSQDKSDKIFYLEDLGISTAGLVSGYRNSNPTNIFNSAFSEWLPQMPNQNLVTLTTKPSAKVPGYLFFLTPKTKAVTRILGGINGLTTLTSPDGKFVLYSQTGDGAPDLLSYDVSKKQSSQLSLQTLPEKCVWSQKNLTVVYCAVPQSISQGTYPDQWYQGVLSFSDALWRIDVSTQNTQMIMTPGDYNAPSLDMTDLTVSSDDSYLVFLNKISGTPWVYRLIETVQPVPPPFLGTTTPLVSPSPISPDMQLIKQ